MRDENVSLDQLIEPSEIISVGAKWFGKNRMYYSDVVYRAGKERFADDRRSMLLMIWRMWNEADGIITFNGDRFDLPKLRGEFIRHDMSPPAPVASIDVYKTTSKMGFTSNKLAHVAPLLGCGEKRKTDGFPLWAEYLEGKKSAREEMRKYNLQDVTVLDRLYDKVRPYITTHPYIGDKTEQCPACGSSHIQQRGRRRTRAYWITRIHCQDCGAWSPGPKKKIG
jgi:uncharacterized protein YprB with RNaseH-like and TPR domain